MVIFFLLIACIAEVIIGSITKDFIWFDLMMITIGFMLLECYRQKNVKIQKVFTYFTAAWFLWGIIMLGFTVAEKLTGLFRNYDIHVFIFGIGVLIMWSGVYMGIIKKLRCSYKISARYTGPQSYTIKGRTSYTPIFSFQYNGVVYSNTSGEVFSKRKLDKKFQIGEEYEIYIDPREPNSFLTNKRIGISWLFWVLLGLLFLFVAFS